MPESVSFESSGDVAVVRLDDGKANAISPAVLEAVGGALDQAEEAGQAVLLTGRPGRFSAGIFTTRSRSAFLTVTCCAGFRYLVSGRLRSVSVMAAMMATSRITAANSNG